MRLGKWTPDGDGVVHLGDVEGDGDPLLAAVVDLEVFVSSILGDWKIRYLGQFTFVDK